MFLQATFRLIKLGFTNFFRNLWLNLVATFVMSLTLMTITTLLITALFANNEIKNIENRIDLEIFLNDKVSAESIDMLKTAISNTVDVKEIEFIDKNKAVERYKELYGDNDTLINYIEQENPLKESLVVKTNKPDDLEKVNSLINSTEFQDIVFNSSYSRNRGIIVRLIGIIDFIEKSGIVIGLLFIVIAVSVVFSTVRIAIYSRKDEIEIMKLVGATDWFVHAPFLIESALYGIFAAILSTLFVAGIFYYITIAASSYLGASADLWYEYFMRYVVFMVIFQILLGLSISVSSAFVAIRRHL